VKFLIIASYAESLSNFRGLLIDALVKQVSSVHICAPFGADDIKVESQLVDKGVVLHDIPMQRTGINPLTDLQTLLSIYCQLRSDKPDMVLAYTIKPVVYGIVAAWLAGVPRRFALITGLGYVFVGGRNGFLTRLVSLQYRFALGRVEKVFFQNPDDEALFRQLRIISKKTKSVVINGSGVDLDLFNVAPLSSNPVFLLIGRLLGDKGVREYVGAARLIKACFPGTRFLLVGWIDENPNSVSKEELEGWVLEGVVEYLGKLSDVRPAIAVASIFVLPSYREGTPRTVLEAMAMGRAIITTDAPGCRETVIDGDNGILVRVRSTHCLAAAMEKLIKNPELIATMGKRSREIAEEKYDVHKVNEVMLREMGIL
jgi:glycosyltransferase involved in cell wall biosynthesis